MQEQSEDTNLFLKKFITKSHVTTCHYSLFLYKNLWEVQNPRPIKKKQNKKHFRRWSSLDHVLSREKTKLCVWLFVSLHHIIFT